MAYLELQNLSKEFDHFKAVDEFSLNVEQGEFISLLGASGCGKTTTLRMVAGFAKPTHGKIFLNGKDITNVPARDRNMGMVFQTYALFPTLSVFENICFGLRLRKMKAEAIDRKVNQLLELGHLEGLAKRYPSQLSGGQQQRVALLRALAIEPTVLLLDEPLSNLDAKLRVEIRKEIKKMQSLLNITTLYVTHDQEEALAVSDRIAVMNKGVIQQTGTPLEIYLNPNTSFVSDFIGQANFLHCSVDSNKKLHFEGHTFPLEASASSSNKVILSFRPNYVVLHPGEYVAPDNFQGLILPVKINFETFLGTVFQIEAETPNGQIVLIELPIEQRKDMQLDRDTQVVLSVPQEHIHLFDA
jgi:putative spermidine/putrescine transport system ATP-binding protein